MVDVEEIGKDEMLYCPVGLLGRDAVGAVSAGDAADAADVWWWCHNLIAACGLAAA